MKIIHITVVSFTLALGLLLPKGARAEDRTQAVTNHLAQALQYEEKAAQQDIVIEDHIRMKQDFMLQVKGEDRIISPQRIEVMNKHCDSIIQSARKLKNDFLEFSKWHRSRAADLNAYRS